MVIVASLFKEGRGAEFIVFLEKQKIVIARFLLEDQ